MQSDYMFTSESVTDGHPDKLCDQISDAIVGHFLRQDALSQVVAECAVSTGIVFIAVKYRGQATINVADTAREVIRRVGYTGEPFDANSCTVMTSLHEFPDGRAPAEDESLLDDAEIDRVVAKDQATLFGYACRHTAALMPLPIWLAHRLARRLSQVRRSGELSYLAPDGKTQVGVEFRKRRPHRIHSVTIVASQRKGRSPSPGALHDDLRQAVIEPVFAEEELRPDGNTRIAINPESPIFQGGPALHAGLTGRKTAVDTYGEWARHSGAALSGKDPGRIDRSGAYVARLAAKSVVAAGLSDECEVHLSYSIGEARPASVHVETFGTSRLDESEIARRVQQQLDFRVAGVVREVGLRKFAASGLLSKLAVYGHVGRTDLELPWERVDRAERLLR